MAKYMTPDFDVTVYEIQENIAFMDGDDYPSQQKNEEWVGDGTGGFPQLP